MLETGLIVESLGYFMPGIYLPVFARALGLGAWTGPLLVALANAAGVVSTVVMGMLCDRMHVTTVVLLCSAGAAAAVLGCWGLATALPLLCVFSVMYGFFAGGFVSTNAGMIKLVRLRDEATDVGTLIGVISAGRGIGAVVSGPLSELLLREHSWEGVAAFGYGSRYGALILFTGITAAVGGVSFLGKKLGWM
jgi:MFS family permease